MTGAVVTSSAPGSSSSGTTACEGFGCPVKIDLLFVIDNSGTMGEEQLNLARNFPGLIAQLEALTDEAGEPVESDVNIMVTTTDFGNPACDESAPKDYVAQGGAPVATPCTDRINRFTGRGPNPVSEQGACYEVCGLGNAAYPSDQFIHIAPDGHNVIGGGPAAALACIGPQGIDGCGYEAPLEAMSQALNPTACWNNPSACEEFDAPFLRDDAILAIAIITDEADCSVRDYSIMKDPVFMEELPTGGRDASSAICWNAGVLCSDLDDQGVYAGCAAVNKGADGQIGVNDEEAVLHPLARYNDLLNSYQAVGREVIMLGVLGVPPVTAHAVDPPHQPLEGGVQALVYRNWRDPQYPAGDVLPSDWAAGQTAVDKQFEFGVGPGCTAITPENVGQGLPPVRIRQVCENLNEPDDPATSVDETKIRCCIESVCGDDFTPALRCLTGLIRKAIPAVQ